MENLGKLNPEFWRARRVFLTGHTGFKGSWLSLWLQHLGAEVTGYALAPPSTPSLFEVGSVDGGMNSNIGDIRDTGRLREVLKRSGAEIVIHMAAQPLVRRSYADPVETYSTNVGGLIEVFEAVRSVGDNVRAIINVTSDKCYENREWVWGYRENDPLGGLDPYSSSKACAEIVTTSYRHSYWHPDRYSEHGVGLASVRAGNVIGGGDWAEDRLIPDLLRALSDSNIARIRNPLAVRPWQHVLEPLSGYLLLAEQLFRDGRLFSQAFNFGPAQDDARPVHWIADRLTALWGDHASWKTESGEQVHEATYLKLDCSKSLSMLQWRSRWSLDAALNAIIKWHKDYLRGDDMRSVTIGQIDAFQREEGIV